MNFKKPLFPLIISLMLASFLALTIWQLRYQTKETIGNVIAADIARLQKIFEAIDRDCGILGFDHQKNPINFLNVKSFSGSEVGSMNLMYPDRWKGPYLPDNLVVENKEYQIVHTKKGYFITPGDGVRLPNGKVMAKDIMLDEDADLLPLACADHALYFEGKPLVLPLEIGRHKVSGIMLEDED